LTKSSGGGSKKAIANILDIYQLWIPA